MSTSKVIKLAILILEAEEKTTILRGLYNDLPPEATSGIYNWTAFWWSSPLLRTGFARILRIGDRYSIDEGLSASVMQRRFQTAWQKASKGRKHPLMLTSFVAVNRDFLVASIPV
jgi:ATP-binding cassette, subfamily C (CFTR/MRP), member 1